MTCNHVICLVLFVLSPCITLVPKPECKQDMATGGGLALPEPLVDDEARSWFKRYEVCASANGWNDQKKLLRLPTLLKGRSWAIYDSLQDEETDTYDHLNRPLNSHDLVVRHTISLLISRLLVNLTISHDLAEILLLLLCA